MECYSDCTISGDKMLSLRRDVICVYLRFASHRRIRRCLVGSSSIVLLAVTFVWIAHVTSPNSVRRVSFRTVWHTHTPNGKFMASYPITPFTLFFLEQTTYHVFDRHVLYCCSSTHSAWHFGFSFTSSNRKIPQFSDSCGIAV